MITLEQIKTAEARAEDLAVRAAKANSPILREDARQAAEHANQLHADRALEEAAAADRARLEATPQARELATAAVSELDASGSQVAAAIAAIGTALARLEEVTTVHAGNVRRHAAAMAAAGLTTEIAGAPGWRSDIAATAWGGKSTVRVGDRHWRDLDATETLDVALARAFGRRPYRGVHWPDIIARQAAQPDAAIDATTTAPARRGRARDVA